jgi:hypothetical protein
MARPTAPTEPPENPASRTPLFYSAFGLSIATNRPVPGLIAQSGSFAADTRVWFDALPVWPTIHDFPDDLWYVSDPVVGNTSGLRVWKLADDAYFRLLYGDGTEFIVDGAGREIWATWPDSSTLEDTATYLLGPVLAFVLRRRGLTCLHASVVAFGDRAIVLMGPAEAGKSTTAAVFATLGYPVLADDVAALVEQDGTLHVLPAYPQLRLWADSVALLYGSADALPLLTPTWDKRALDLTQHGLVFQKAPLPLAAIYVLGGRCTGGEPRVEPLYGREILRTLLGNTYVGYLIDASKHGEEFAMLARVAARVPVRRVILPAAPTHVAQVCAVILEDCEASGCIPSPATAR